MGLVDNFSGSKGVFGEIEFRPMKYEDLQTLADWPKFEDPLLNWANFPHTTRELQKRWYAQQQKPHLLWIVVIIDGQIIGRCSLTEPITGDGLLFGIVLHPHFLEKGYGTRTTAGMMNYVKRMTDKTFVWLESRYDNKRAHRVWEKAGFVYQGIHYRREVFGRYDRYVGYKIDLYEADLPEIEIITSGESSERNGHT